nr:MAG TPA_asm: hypothetical protein [Caudoviricetes sp.]
MLFRSCKKSVNVLKYCCYADLLSADISLSKG